MAVFDSYKIGSETSKGHVVHRILRHSDKVIVYKNDKERIIYEYTDGITNLFEIETLYGSLASQIDSLYDGKKKLGYLEDLGKALGNAIEHSDGDWQQAFEIYKTMIDTKKRDVRIIRAVVSFLIISALLGIGTLLMVIIHNNKTSFELDNETIALIAYLFNSILWIILMFMLGMFGAITRILISDIELIKNYKIIIGSGMLSIISWFSVKSGLLMVLFSGYIKKVPDLDDASTIFSVYDFYSIATFAIFVGMFSSTIYISINSKVEQILKNKSKK